MKILVVIGSQINGFPPVRNLIEILLENDHYVTVLAKDRTGLFISKNPRFRFITIPEDQGFFKPAAYLKKQKFMRAVVEEEMKRHDILWTATDATVRDLGDVVLRYPHVMQLMELIKDIPKMPSQTFLMLNIKKYAKNAFKVVVPEYNRAHIQKAWWDLESLPFVLPNKMKIPTFENESIPEEVKKVLRELEHETKKIVLYQGVFYKDRDLGAFIEGVKKVQHDYSIYLMGNETDYKRELVKKNGAKTIPFIKPPFHLLVTQKAHIGLLPYKAAKYLHYDTINALYCAPNKIFEYSGYGIPMIGTDVPGLQIPFSTYNIGYTCQPYTADTVVENIKKIEDNYKSMSQNCLDYYSSIDMNCLVEKIICD